MPFVDADYTGSNNACHSKVDRELCVQNQNWFRNWSLEIRMAFGLSALGFYTDALNSRSETLEISSAGVTECLASRRRRERWRYFKGAECRTRQTPHKRRDLPSARITLMNIIFPRSKLLFSTHIKYLWISRGIANLLGRESTVETVNN